MAMGAPHWRYNLGPIRCHRRQQLTMLVVPLLVLVATVALTVDVVDAIPASYTILHNGKECLYERLRADEYLTASVFISSGTELKGTVNIDGPVAGLDEGDDGSGEVSGGRSSRAMLDEVEKYEKGHRYGKRIANKVGGEVNKLSMPEIEVRKVDYLDFEKMVEEAEDLDYDDYYEHDDDDDAELYHEYVGDDELISQQERKAREVKFEAEKKRHKDEMKRKMEKRKEGIARNGEAWQNTVQARVPGWYRVCVTASWYQITVEIELRKSSELGDPADGHPHVPTYENRALQDAQKLRVDNEAEEEDLKNAKDQIYELNRLLSQIKRKQHIERHELALHSAVNEHSHSRMVLNSLMETILFIAVTGFQVYSIRKWFEQAPMLGR